MEYQNTITLLTEQPWLIADTMWIAEIQWRCQSLSVKRYQPQKIDPNGEWCGLTHNIITREKRIIVQHQAPLPVRNTIEQKSDMVNYTTSQDWNTKRKWEIKRAQLWCCRPYRIIWNDHRKIHEINKEAANLTASYEVNVPKWIHEVKSDAVHCTTSQSTKLEYFHTLRIMKFNNDDVNCTTSRSKMNCWNCCKHDIA